MIYRDRKYLSILTLTEDRDYVTYDELIHVLEERSSDVVYIEQGGILCGLLSSRYIKRSCNGKTHCVPVNKKFTSVHPEEYLRARQIFKDRKGVTALPVISEDGRLLGGYVRWDDLLCRDHAELLCKDPYVLQDLKEDIQDAIFVEPARRETNRAEMFSQWKKTLESEGIHLQVIQPWAIKDYMNGAQKFLFTDEDEKRGIEVLNRYLYGDFYNKKQVCTTFFTITDYLYRMRQINLILKKLQSQGVFVLVFDFQENSNQFLAELNERIRKRNKEYGVDSGMLPEGLKRSFLGELYCGAYKEQSFPLPISFHRRLGISYLSDIETEFVHIQNGERLTVGQPEEYDRCIYLFGPCIVLAPYVSDQYTIPSLLQSEINQAGLSCKVVNRGIYGSDYMNVEQLQLESFKQGDIVVIDQLQTLVDNIPILNMTDVLEKHDAPTDWFVDGVRHCNHKANQVFAHAIYEALVPVLQQPPKERTPVEQVHDYVGRFYLRHYFTNFDPAGHGVIGSIVMNCNPFTFGHRFLIEKALKTVDFLIVFVVEEDGSVFSFQERFAMVCQGTNDLEHIMVVPSGPYILSKNTFPEYFDKINDEDLIKNTEDDITLFAEKIAPTLGITYRFVGEEREDKVTNEYNEAMKRILPRYGVQVVEIPRKANGRSVISASRVRQCLETNQMEELDELVPASTKRILFFEDK